MLVTLLLGNDGVVIKSVIFKILVNIFLIQEWFPIQDKALNLVSWYLCVCVFLYFAFPFILTHIEKGYSKKSCWGYFVFYICYDGECDNRILFADNI